MLKPLFAEWHIKDSGYKCHFANGYVNVEFRKLRFRRGWMWLLKTDRGIVEESNDNRFTRDEIEKAFLEIYPTPFHLINNDGWKDLGTIEDIDDIKDFVKILTKNK